MASKSLNTVKLLDDGFYIMNPSFCYFLQLFEEGATTEGMYFRSPYAEQHL